MASNLEINNEDGKQYETQPDDPTPVTNKSDSLFTPPSLSAPKSATTTQPPAPDKADFLFTPPSQPAPKAATTSVTDDDNLNFIREQLNFLNNESGELATPIHMSNKQKRQELAKKHQELAAKRKDLRSPAKQFLKLHSRGIKRSPQKLIPRKPKRVRRSIGFTDKSPQKEPHHSSGADADTSDDDSSDDENWKIIDESSDGEIDKALEENAAKQNLTVVNVKNILHQVITNEDVVAMVKNTLNEVLEEDTSSDLIPATFEPKMTRAKFKEVLEKDGSIHHPWPLSPLKKVDVPKTSFLDLPLPEDDEDEDDDEYNPDKEIETGSYSDEDSESVTSSQVSDLGSPRPSTPATPSSVSRFSDLDRTPQGEEEIKSPMGPPARPPLSSQKSMLGKHYSLAMAELDRKNKQKEEETIALRTRSKLSLTDTSLTELESNFVAPDITRDMYDTSCDDREWMTFLTGLQTLPVTVTEDTNDDDNDPEYNYLEEAEDEELDMEDLRCDRAVQISRKEMNELMDELLEAYQDNDMIEEEEIEKLKKRALETVAQTSRPVKTVAPPVHMCLTENQRLQLGHQMRKHVQLLTQMYVIASGNEKDYQDVKENSQFLLNELKKFSDVNSTMTKHSAYNVCNLNEAVHLVNENRDFVQIDPKNVIVNTRSRIKKTAVSPTKKGRKSVVEKNPTCMSPEKGIENMLCRNYKQLSEKKKDLIYSVLGENTTFNDPSKILPKSTLPYLTTQQRDIFWRSLIFIYPELIPQGSFLLCRNSPKNTRVCFTEAEDNLLALGLVQFKSLPFYRQLIQKFMLPCKTEDQIKIRIKNLTANNSPCNAVKTFKKEKKVKNFPICAEPFDASKIKPVMLQDAALLPTWCKEMKIREIILMHDEELEGCYNVQRSSSVNIPVVSKKRISVDGEHSRSAPTTPLMVKDNTTAQKVLLFDSTSKTTTQNVPTTTSNVTNTSESLRDSLSMPSLVTSPQVTKLQDIGRKRCVSPGFIRLSEDNLASPLSETDSRSATPVNIETLDPAPVRKSGDIMIMHGQTPATCAAPTFVVVNKSSGAPVTGRLDSTVLSSALPSSICSVVHMETDNSPKPISPTKLINDLSKEVSREFTPSKVTPPKGVAEIVASYAPYYLSPELVKDRCVSQDVQEKTPTKTSPISSRYRPVAPKPIILSTFTSPKKKVSPFLEKKVKSPRRKQLQTKALSIRPKGFIPTKPHVSPVKKAASSIIHKALKWPKILLPKPHGMISRPLHVHVRKGERTIEHEDEDMSLQCTSESEGMETDYLSGDCIDTIDVDDMKMDTLPAVLPKRQKHNSESNRSVESDDTQSEADGLYDSQNEDDVIDDEDHLADLMAASSTICFASQRQSAKDKENRKKGMNKKDATLAMLAPDLLEIDPHKDDRDTAFAQAYLNRTKEALKGNTEKYEEFLKILYDFGKSEQSPVKLYQDLKLLLADYPDLVSDFAGFLLPEQAIECGCLKASQEFKRAKVFLRKLEVYLARHPTHYQKVMKIFTHWSQSDSRNVKELREALEPMIRMQPHLLEELSLFFEEEKPPETYLTDYEEITLDDSDAEPDPDGYEVIELPDEQDINGTKMCQCSCHKNTLDQNYLKRNRHCYSCCLKVIDGELYFRVSNKILKKVNVIYHKPIKARSRETTKPPDRLSDIAMPQSNWMDDDPVAEKENVDISLLAKVKKRKEKVRYSSGSDSCSQDAMLQIGTSSQVSSPLTGTLSAPFTPPKIDENNSGDHHGMNLDQHPASHLVVSSSSSQLNIQSVNEVTNNVRSVDEEANISPRKSESQLASNSSTTIPYSHDSNTGHDILAKAFSSSMLAQESNTGQDILAKFSSNILTHSQESNTGQDILAKALNLAMISQGDISLDPDNLHSIGFPGVKIISSPKTLSAIQRPSSSRSGKHVVKELFTSDTLEKDRIKPAPEETSNIGVVTFTEEASNIGVIQSLDPSKRPENIILSLSRNEDSMLSQSSKLVPSDTIQTTLPCVAEECEPTDNSEVSFPTFTSSQTDSPKLYDLSSENTNKSEQDKAFSQPDTTADTFPCLEKAVSQPDTTADISPCLEKAVSQPDTTADISPCLEKRVSQPNTTVDTSPCLEKPVSQPGTTADISPCLEKAVSQPDTTVDTFQCLEKPVRGPETTSVVSPCGVIQQDQDVSRSSSRLSEGRTIESPKSVISIVHPEIESYVIGFNTDSNSSVSSLQSTEINRLTPRRTAHRKEEKSPQSIWNKDTDKTILEAVKNHGPGLETFTNICKKLPGKTPQQVSERFHQLLEILATEDDQEEP